MNCLQQLLHTRAFFSECVFEITFFTQLLMKTEELILFLVNVHVFRSSSRTPLHGKGFMNREKFSKELRIGRRSHCY